MDVAAMSAETATICTQTGLALVRSWPMTVYRIQKSSFGPMNPPERSGGVDRMEWSRWDVPDARTIYTADSRLGAFMETLSWARPAEMGTMAEIFDEDDDVDPDERLEDAVRAEWRQQHGGWSPGHIPASWRDGRMVYKLQLPTDGWFVHITASTSIAALNRIPGLVDLVVDEDDPDTHRITAAPLLDQDREFTTRVANWVHDQTLFDGSRPHGIFYHSKLGDDLVCRAIWLRRIADGAEPSSEPTIVQTPAGRPIDAGDKDLKEALRLLGIKKMF